MTTMPPETERQKHKRRVRKIWASKGPDMTRDEIIKARERLVFRPLSQIPGGE